jgi:hypothetical protein
MDPCHPGAGNAYGVLKVSKQTADCSLCRAIKLVFKLWLACVLTVVGLAMVAEIAREHASLDQGRPAHVRR